MGLQTQNASVGYTQPHSSYLMYRVLYLLKHDQRIEGLQGHLKVILSYLKPTVRNH